MAEEEIPTEFRVGCFNAEYNIPEEDNEPGSISIRHDSMDESVEVGEQEFSDLEDLMSLLQLRISIKMGRESEILNFKNLYDALEAEP